MTDDEGAPLAFDPDTIVEDPPSPDTSSDPFSGPLPPSQADTPTGGLAEPQGDAEASQDEVSNSFDPRWREPFEGLLFIGALRKPFRWLGHTYVLRTLRDGELMDVGLLIKPYMGTMGETKAYQTGVLAVALETVDGKALPLPPILDEGEGSLVVLTDRFNHIRRFYPPTIDHLYNRWLELEAEANKTVEKMLERYGQAES